METVDTVNSEAGHEMQEKPSRLCYQPSKLPSFLRELSFSDKRENIYALSLFSLFIEHKSLRGCIAPGFVFLVLLLACGSASCLGTLGQLSVWKPNVKNSAPAAGFIHSLSSSVVLTCV